MKYLLFFTVAILVTVIMLLIYGAVQQTYRTGLNDPQIQIARTVSSRLEQGKSVETLLKDEPFNINESLTPFVVLYDASGKPLRSDGLLDGKMPQMPVSLFNDFSNDKERRISWQPRKGTRMAMVIVKTNTLPVQFVAVGRSMEEVENRIEKMSSMVFIGWVLCMAVISIAGFLQHFIMHRNISKRK